MRRSSSSSPVLATMSNGLVVSRNTGARRASSSGENEPRRIGVPSESSVCAFSSDLHLGDDVLVAALRRPALAGRGAARRSRGRRARARARTRRGRLRDRARPRRRRTRAARSGSRRSCASVPRNLAPRPSPGFDPGGSARCTSSKPAATVFFDFDISVRRRRRSSGRLATPTAASYSLGTGRPVESAEQAVRARAGETDETEVLHRGAGYRSGSLQRPMSKKTKKRRLKARRNKANHGKRPRAGR